VLAPRGGERVARQGRVGRPDDGPAERRVVLRVRARRDVGTAGEQLLDQIRPTVPGCGMEQRAAEIPAQLGAVEVDDGLERTVHRCVDDDLTIVKEWREHHLRRIQEAVEATVKPLVTVLAIDDEEALIAVVHQMGIREVAVIRAERQGKMFPGADTRAAYFQEVTSKVSSMDLGTALLVIGPGFEREDFARFLRDRDSALAGMIRLHGTSQAGVAGIQEAMKAGLGAKILEETRVAQETRLVERVLEEIAKGGLFAYGPQEIQTAIDSGAVETLLVTDAKVKDLAVEELMRRVESARGTVVIVSSRHEAGKKLEGLGGLAALLRFPIR